MLTKRGQSGLMEYMVMTIMILFVVVIGFFFLFGFESGKLEGDKSRNRFDSALSIAGILARSDILAKRGLVFDDSKLIVADCETIKTLVKTNACVSVEKVLFSGESKTACSLSNYPECNSWVLCKDLCTGKTVGTLLPVNIYRKFSGKTEIGIISVRLPA